MLIWKAILGAFLQEEILRYNKTPDDEYTKKQQPDRTQHFQEIEHSHDILSIIDEQCINDSVEVSNHIFTLEETFPRHTPSS